ncbi:hypothetical protein KU75_00120 [Pectobacterium odoriferum]|uniref:Uncharacterized protein n=1 Tax=Pectobacterium odoriferum TaxID=78398 RepID=A0ABR4VUW0_9GAMM|nr:hypothetical protein KU75_00120 [Pectobacterium odoriferum]
MPVILQVACALAALLCTLACASPQRADESLEKETGIELYELLIFAKKFNEITLYLSVKYARLFSIML